jgi:hypothetical protein
MRAILRLTGGRGNTSDAGRCFRLRNASPNQGRAKLIVHADACRKSAEAIEQMMKKSADDIGARIERWS